MKGNPPTIREFMLSLDYPFEFDECQYRVAEKKLSLGLLPLSIREFHDIRARGGSKTFDTMIVALYLASLGFEGIWFSALAKQMEQPKKYLKKIIERSYLKYLIAQLNKESVLFQNEGELRIYNLTEDNARSPRADFVVFDELARADRDAYNASEFILSVTQLGFIFNISTPCKATVEEDRYEIIKRREIVHNEELISELWWSDISFLARKKEWYEEQKRLLPGWYFRQENECSHELPSGAVFQNVIYTDIPSWIQAYDDTPLVSGIDWNPVQGHWLVGGRWLMNDEAFVVQHTINLGVGYTHQLNDPKFPSTAKIYSRIRKFFMHGKRLNVEDGGINIAYCDWLRERRAEDGSLRNDFVTYEEWDSAGLNKTNAVLDLQSVRIYVDEMLFPELAKQIGDAHWDEDADRPVLAKDPADSPHALDALLHAASSKLKRDVYLYREEW